MDHPTSPVAWICTPTSPEPNQPIVDIANQNNLWFLDFFSKVVFFAIFGHFGPWRPPSKGPAKKMRALGSLLRVPSPPPDPILSTKLQHHVLLPGACSCTRHCSTLPWFLVILHLKLKMDALKGSRGRKEVRIAASDRGWCTSCF